MSKTEKPTVPNSPVGADGEQPIANKHNQIIPEYEPQYNLQTTENNASCPGENGQERLQTVSMTELYDTVYPPKTPVIENLLYNGMYFFAGAPKIGKSFFVAQLGYHVSMGLPLWNYPVHQGTVLYLALEDDYGRLQKRLSQMFGLESSEHFHFAIRAKTLNGGLEEQLCAFITRHQDTKLVIVDTFQKVREAGGEKYSYASDYEIVARLKQFSDMHHICLLVVHHTRKMESSDSMEMISGSTGLLGAADGAFMLLKEKRTDNKAVLEVVGRDQQDQMLYLDFNREVCIWELIKTETELWKQPPDPVLEEIAGILSEKNPSWRGTATELLQQLPDLDMQPNILAKKLNTSAERLLTEYGIVYQNKRGHSAKLIILTLNQEKV